MEPIAILAAVAALFGGYKVWESSSQKRAEQRKRLAIEAEKTRKLEYANEQITKFEKWLTPVLVIDSNIWMNESYDSFFRCLHWACLRKKYKVELFGVQFDEISNIKKAVSYGDPRNSRARTAINRVERLQKAGFLNVTPITIDSARGAYADPTIVKILAQKSREGRECTLFSDDKELRVRVRQNLMNNAEADWTIVELESYIGTCTKIVEGMQVITERRELERKRREEEHAKQEELRKKEEERIKKEEDLRQILERMKSLKPKSEQAGTGQPATRPESKSEGGDKPLPETEERSR